jgi:hypothetical protein
MLCLNGNAVKPYPQITSEYLDIMRNVSFLKILTKLFVPSKDLEGKSINHHKRDIKMNHTEL